MLLVLAAGTLALGLGLLLRGKPPAVAPSGARAPAIAAQTAPEPHADQESLGARPTDADAALAALRHGNRRFVSGAMQHPRMDADVRAQLEAGQRPLATVLGCSDSRVPPEMIFDEGFGDLFVIRVAGNVVGTNVMASVEYGVEHLQTPLLVVLGHEHCGAVTAAVKHMCGELPEDSEPPEILELVQHMEPGLVHVHDDEPLDEAVHQAVDDNVRHTMRELLEVPHIARAVAEGRLTVVGAIYDLDGGEVRFLEAEPSGA